MGRAAVGATRGGMDGRRSRPLLGSRVISRRLGPPQIGTVIGVWHGPLWARLRERYGHRFDHWDRHYPDWRGGLVCTVLLDQPFAPMSLDEFLAESPTATAEDYRREPAVPDVTYPLEDLEEL
jgi:hypothetical protein